MYKEAIRGLIEDNPSQIKPRREENFHIKVLMKLAMARRRTQLTSEKGLNDVIVRNNKNATGITWALHK